MRKLFKSKLFITILVITVLLSGFTVASLLSNNRSGPVHNVVSALIRPVQISVTSIGDFTKRLFSGISENDALREENDRLREEVAKLEAEIRDLEHHADENEAMRALMGIIGSDIEYSLQMGNIISHTGHTWSRVLTADVGTSDGISVYDAVITAEGLVGFVSSVDLTSCRITTLVDSAMSCSALLSRSGYTGVAEGHVNLMSSGLLQLTLLPGDAEVSVGETVVTSGLGGIYPKGLVVGTVESTSLADNGKSRTAILRPKVDITEISTVFFVTDFKKVPKE